ncbi:hypothetical protein [Prevotella intermedia]|uniref:hypothetical protein n=1 Tax=Prevotella intermedia TaxID=28131 RepID=UPI00200670E2|nr:hypothetical protein [Prevotella intermedia]MCK6144211.1 hypothetical protein [Prevotella intermedia]
MKKVQYYPDNPFDFHKKVVSSKRKGPQKNRIEALETNIEKSYKAYNEKFTNNQLGTLKPIALQPDEQEALKGLYKFSAKSFKDLYVCLTTTKSNRRDMLCPNCTLTDCNQLDHYIPKSEFPEFSANPRNLMQCCSICNQKKLDRWLNGGQPIFLNLYLDDLPQEQYLFVDILINNGVPIIKFYLQNRTSIDPTLFSRIESHYRELDLCKRFVERADSVISEILRDYIAAKQASITVAKFIEILKSRAMQEQQDFGFNYWKAILTLECCKSLNFLDFLNNQNATP